MAEDVDPREPGWWIYVKMFKTGLEIVAIFVAAYCSWSIFPEDTQPSLGKLAELSGTLEFSHRTATSCDMDYAVSFKNLSKHRVNVAKSRVCAWYMTKSATPTEATPVVYLPPMQSLEGD